MEECDFFRSLSYSAITTRPHPKPMSVEPKEMHLESEGHEVQSSQLETQQLYGKHHILMLGC